MNYIYIDESGDLGKGSKYFIIGAIIVDDYIKLERSITKIRRKFKKELGNFHEIKGNKTKNFIIKKLLTKVNSLNSEIFIIVFDKKDKYKINYKNDFNVLYDIIASELAKEIKITKSTLIIVDTCKPKKKLVNNFNQRFLDKINNSKNHQINIIHQNSINQKGLQVIDVIVWAAFQYMEHNNSEFINLIENKKIKKVFKD
ncbi:DUF3800 domain-containing protein [Methanobrevibacter woesei]|uniref:DUF3800 domain-containing protein n=1 Tax=Methanobrevibacter woesei TaxID=190976 RepID=UPI0024B7BDF3|nr:DUF3800 domain-containing protein [Methanobrevibacter woesei]